MNMLRRLFKRNKMIHPSIGHHVRHNDTTRYGRVVGTALIKLKGIKVHALTVAFEDGTLGAQIPEQEFTIVGGRRLA